MIHRLFRPPAILVLMIVALASALPVDAAPPSQEGTPIQYGATLSGTITEEVPCIYFWFQGTAGDPISIDMTRTSGTLDGLLDLYQQDGGGFTQSTLMSNDDRPGGGLDPLIEFTLPVTDWYTIAACRLQAPQMRATTGTFDLTLTGPSAISPTSPAHPSGGLTEGLFSSGPTATPAATSGNATTGALGGAVGAITLVPGKPISGELAAEATAKQYALDVRAGDMVVIDWQRVDANFAPLLRVMAEDGTIWAQAGTPQAVNALTLAFYAPVDAALTLAVTRHGDSIDGTGGKYTLQVSAQSTEITTAPDTNQAASTASVAETACQFGNQAVYATGSSAQLTSAYTAAGDGLTPEELTATGDFATDDDFNVVFVSRFNALPIQLTGYFCAPGGINLTSDDVTVRENDTEYMFGVDWEYFGTPWVTGEWWVEIYIGNTLELVLSYHVN